jgi:MFS-type transporter involved in bile tolerance (Atg22 family)
LIRDVHVETRLTLTGLDLVATSVVAFVGGWIIGYLATIS